MVNGALYVPHVSHTVNSQFISQIQCVSVHADFCEIPQCIPTLISTCLIVRLSLARPQTLTQCKMSPQLMLMITKTELEQNYPLMLSFTRRE